jgi:primosomal protein N' (replication factor Y)
VLHSGLTAGQRYDQWLRIRRGEVQIAIGARSAVFAPFQRTGLIVVDEEHDTSYKQEGSLRYNACDLAVVRAKLDKGVVLLGSATPSIQSSYNASQKKYVELTLGKRVEERSLPEITVVDLRKTRDLRGSGRFITAELHQAMTDSLARGEQVLLFLNRRGFASFPVCRDCGESIKCKNCDISLTLHRQVNAFKCHYCGFMRPTTTVCDKCGSAHIKNLGLGTEKVESFVAELFPAARVARMDRDTTSRRGAIVRILKDLRHRRIDILIGTQMVAKGHDFPLITVVGILCADLSMSFPDFRAGERTFQLLAQVAGRAGRGDKPGKVILQTYNPEHFSIQAAQNQDFREFYRQEILFRRALKYPPFSRIIQVKIAGRDKRQTETHARSLGEVCRRLGQQDDVLRKSVDVMGPIEAALARIAGKYRWQILLKGQRAGTLHRFVWRVMRENPALFNRRGVTVAVDVDPFFMM